MRELDVEIFDLKDLNDVNVKEHYQVKMSSRFADLRNLDDNDVDINRTRENIRENMKASATESLGYFEYKRHKLWFDEKCSKL
jgi:hypothetical protein